MPGLRLHLQRDTATGGAGVAPAAPVEPPAGEATPPGDDLTIAAPFIGVFYRGARPGDPPLVAPGDTVEPDQPLGLIEVMKTFHEVTAGRRARVVAVLAEDAAPVEYGQPLFELAVVSGQGAVPADS